MCRAVCCVHEIEAKTKFKVSAWTRASSAATAPAKNIAKDIAKGGKDIAHILKARVETLTFQAVVTELVVDLALFGYRSAHHRLHSPL